MTAPNSRLPNVTPLLVTLPRRAFPVIFLSLMAASLGCGNSVEPTESLTPVARRETPSIDAPLTDAEVRMFLDIVSQLPGGKPPEFNPSVRSTIDDRLPAETLISEYRSEYRRMFDPLEQGSHWRRDGKLTKTLADHGTDPEEFAALLTRIGCAVAATTVSSRSNLQEASEKADEQLAAITTQLNALDNRTATARVSPIAVNQRRQPLVDQLKSIVALSEFSAILLHVPPESRAVIVEYKHELAVHLPQQGELDLFERTYDSPAVIVPVSHETLAPR